MKSECLQNVWVLTHSVSFFSHSCSTKCVPSSWWCQFEDNTSSHTDTTRGERIRDEPTSFLEFNNNDKDKKRWSRVLEEEEGVCMWSDWTFAQILPHSFHLRIIKKKERKKNKKAAGALADHHIITSSLIARPLLESRPGAQLTAMVGLHLIGLDFATATRNETLDPISGRHVDLSSLIRHPLFKLPDWILSVT